MTGGSLVIRCPNDATNRLSMEGEPVAMESVAHSLEMMAEVASTSAPL